MCEKPGRGQSKVEREQEDHYLSGGGKSWTIILPVSRLSRRIGLQDAGQKQMVRSRDLSTGNNGNMSPCNMVLVGRDGIDPVYIPHRMIPGQNHR